MGAAIAVARGDNRSGAATPPEAVPPASAEDTASSPRSYSRAHSRSDAFLLTFIGKPVLGRRIGILVTPDQTVGGVLAQLEAVLQRRLVDVRLEGLPLRVRRACSGISDGGGGGDSEAPAAPPPTPDDDDNVTLGSPYAPDAYPDTLAACGVRGHRDIVLHDLPVTFFAEHYFRSRMLAATARVLIPAECSAVS